MEAQRLDLREASVRARFDISKPAFLAQNAWFSVEGKRTDLIIYRSGVRIVLPKVEVFLHEAFRVQSVFR